MCRAEADVDTEVFWPQLWFHKQPERRKVQSELKGLNQAEGLGLERLVVWFIFITTQPLQAAGVANYFWNKVEGSHQSYYLPVAEGGTEPTEGDTPPPPPPPPSVRDSRPHLSTLRDISPKMRTGVHVCVCVYVNVWVLEEAKSKSGSLTTPPTASIKIFCRIYFSATNVPNN